MDDHVDGELLTRPAIPTTAPGRPPRAWRPWGILAALVIAWIAAYALNAPLWRLLVFRLGGLDPDTRLGDAVHFFLYDTVKVLLLLVGLMYVIGMARASLGPERLRAALQGSHVVTGYLIAAVLGAVTPFCSCSSIPVFIGLAAAGVPVGVAFTFLIASPLINEVGVAMLFGMFGWRVPVLYVALGLTIAISAGLLLSRLRLERWIEPFVFTSPVSRLGADGSTTDLSERMDAAREEVLDILRKVWIFVVVGVAIGAGIHGWVPDGFFTTWAGPDNPWALPIAAVAGVPLYANIASVVPLVQALSAKGVALGTLMAFMTSTVALSVPSLVMLRRVIKLPLLLIFTGVVTVGAMLVGLVFNLLV